MVLVSSLKDEGGEDICGCCEVGDEMMVQGCHESGFDEI